MVSSYVVIIVYSIVQYESKRELHVLKVCSHTSHVICMRPVFCKCKCIKGGQFQFNRIASIFLPPTGGIEKMTAFNTCLDETI